MRTIYFIGILFLMLPLAGQSQNSKVANYYEYSTECLGVEHDGTQTLKVWGKGRNRFDAIEQAKKNALYDVLFKGISAGSSACTTPPLVPELNARETYSDYFNGFFKDDGPFKEFISLRDERLDKKISRERKATNNQVTLSMVIQVNKPALKEKLKKDGIIK
jgi:hypothetical protein